MGKATVRAREIKRKRSESERDGDSKRNNLRRPEEIKKEAKGL